jgi:hypothetical protein
MSWRVVSKRDKKYFYGFLKILYVQLSGETEEDQENYIQRNQALKFITSKYERINARYCKV